MTQCTRALQEPRDRTTAADADRRSRPVSSGCFSPLASVAPPLPAAPAAGTGRRAGEVGVREAGNRDKRRLCLECMCERVSGVCVCVCVQCVRVRACIKSVELESARYSTRVVKPPRHFQLVGGAPLPDRITLPPQEQGATSGTRQVQLQSLGPPAARYPKASTACCNDGLVERERHAESTLAPFRTLCFLPPAQGRRRSRPGCDSRRSSLL